MGMIKQPTPILYFTSIIFNNEPLLPIVEEELEGLLGPIREKTAPELFTHTDYYEKEMGSDLRRLFILFAQELPRERMPDIKTGTNAIELFLEKDGRRNVNIDPGYITMENIILATTKGYTHRVYLEKGIYADLTLMFTSGTYRSLQWTYPDYGSPPVIALFNRWRGILKEGLKGWR